MAEPVRIHFGGLFPPQSRLRTSRTRPYYGGGASRKDFVKSAAVAPNQPSATSPSPRTVRAGAVPGRSAPARVADRVVARTQEEFAVPTKGFQIEVTTRGQAGIAVFAVAASSQSHAEQLLRRGGHMTGIASAELKRQLSVDDVAKYALAPGSILKLRSDLTPRKR